MKVNEYKADCSIQVGPWKAQGLAHIVEVEYSDRIRFCNFVMQITTDQLNDAPKDDLSAPAGLTLPDGRTAAVRITHGKVASGYFEVAGAGNF